MNEVNGMSSKNESPKSASLKSVSPESASSKSALLRNPSQSQRRFSQVSRTAFQSSEWLVSATLIGLVLLVGLADHQFWSVANAFSIVRSALVPAGFALGAGLVLISGGIDVSFMAVGVFAGYATVRILPNGSSPLIAVAGFAIAITIGGLLGAINAGCVVGLRIPTLIATLGTQTAFRGILLLFVGTRYIDNIPPSLARLSRTDLIVFTTEQGTKARMHVLIVPLIALATLLAWFLRRTLLGRTLFAIGGSEESSRRIGLPVAKARIVAFVLAGAVAGFAGLTHIVLAQQANPFALGGQELDVLAAAVIGGAAITGGRGSVRGVVLGVVLTAVINSSLITLGVPSSWQRATVGLFLLVGVAIQASNGRRTNQQQSDEPPTFETPHAASNHASNEPANQAPKLSNPGVATA